MKPADMKKRFCDECELHVHDLAAMTKREAKAVLASEATEGLCIRYLYDQHGAVVFSDDARLVAPSALVRAKRFIQGARGRAERAGERRRRCACGSHIHADRKVTAYGRAST